VGAQGKRKIVVQNKLKKDAHRKPSKTGWQKCMEIRWQKRQKVRKHVDNCKEGDGETKGVMKEGTTVGSTPTSERMKGWAEKKGRQDQILEQIRGRNRPGT